MSWLDAAACRGARLAADERLVDGKGATMSRFHKVALCMWLLSMAGIVASVLIAIWSTWERSDPPSLSLRIFGSSFVLMIVSCVALDATAKPDGPPAPRDLEGRPI